MDSIKDQYLIKLKVLEVKEKDLNYDLSNASLKSKNALLLGNHYSEKAEFLRIQLMDVQREIQKVKDKLAELELTGKEDIIGTRSIGNKINVIKERNKKIGETMSGNSKRVEKKSSSAVKHNLNKIAALENIKGKVVGFRSFLYKTKNHKDIRYNDSAIKAYSKALEHKGLYSKEVSNHFDSEKISTKANVQKAIVKHYLNKIARINKKRLKYSGSKSFLVTRRNLENQFGSDFDVRFDDSFDGIYKR